MDKKIKHFFSAWRGEPSGAKRRVATQRKENHHEGELSSGKKNRATSKGKLSNMKRRAEQHEEESRAMLRGKPNNAKRRVEWHKEESPVMWWGELSSAKKRPKQHEEESRTVGGGEPSNVRRRIDQC